ncbi:MAG: 4Fe-4S binding protein [Lachnospiraceae bacterium]|jgi:Fe-S-cluster-containing hydrogenase component 2|nr:4Fe-4S binding protein [Lachnospiraceae bacterium]
MLRKIIEIDQDKCTGCGICADACHEGAIGMVDSKARLLREDYCDGLGDCLPTCPTGAIHFVEREAADFRLAAPSLPAGATSPAANSSLPAGAASPVPPSASELRQWPVQIKLVPVSAPYFSGAHLLIAADCAAYARAGFHGEFIHGRITLIGCPKLDGVDYSEKLIQIMAANDIKSVTVVRMEVPCCGGIENAAVTALKNSGKFIPWQVVTITTDGRIKDI